MNAIAGAIRRHPEVEALAVPEDNAADRRADPANRL